MKLNNLSLFLKDNTGDTTSNAYIPSIGRYVAFKSLTVADVKTIARLSIFPFFDLNSELIKLSLFDKLILEDEESCRFNI